jgi:hypothetical protein
MSIGATEKLNSSFLLDEVDEQELAAEYDTDFEGVIGKIVADRHVTCPAEKCNLTIGCEKVTIDNINEDPGQAAVVFFAGEPREVSRTSVTVKCDNCEDPAGCKGLLEVLDSHSY